MIDQAIEGIEAHWGTGFSIYYFVPSAADDEGFRNWWTQFERLSMSPGAALDSMRWIFEIDARNALPIIRVPTMVLHTANDPMIPATQGQYLAEHIEGVKYVELQGIDHFAWASGDAVTDEIEEFLTGTRPAPETDRVLATVLFTDIVGSTELVSRLGDRAWRDLLGNHHFLVRKELARFRGREVDTAGDGFLATFDGPARAVRCACNIRDSVHQLGIEIRAGLHTGEVELMGDKIGGVAVHIGARVSAAARANEVLVSSTIKDLVVGSGLRFIDRGTQVLKGVPDEWRLFEVMQP
jgi:class 3 adenylate cyclase